MKVDFEWLELKAFKCFADVFLDLDPIGLHFIAGANRIDPHLGANACGKTSLFDGLTWVPYGRTIEGLRNPDLLPWADNDGTTYGGLQLRVDGKTQLIERTIGPNTLTLNGKPTTQEDIEKLIGLSFDTFCHTILLGQDQPLFLDLRPQQKMDLFANVLMLDRWEQRSAYASKRERKLMDKLAERFADSRALVSRRQELEASLKKIKQLSAEWTQQQEDRLANADKEIAVLEKQLPLLRQKYDDAKLVLDGAQTEIEPLRQQLAKMGADIDAAKREEGLLLHKLQQSHTHCPTCGQPLKNSKQIKQHLQAELDKVRKRLQPRRMRNYEHMSATLRTFVSKADIAQTTVSAVAPDLYGIDQKIKDLRKLRSQRRDEANPYFAQVQDLRKSLTKCKALYEENERLVSNYRRLIERVSFWIKGFKDIQLYIVEEVLNELTLVVDSMLPEVGLDGWSVHFDIEKETKSGTIKRGLNVSIYSPDREDVVKFESWSGGEKQRLRLVTALALSQVLLNHAGVQVNMEILDEPTKGLSKEGVNDLIAYLNERSHTINRSIFLADHHVIQSALFRSVVTAVKDKDGSYLEVS